MLNWEEEWNISFAGCGFSSIYYLGALSCIAERVPRLVQGASKICGASSGCLVAAGLTVGIPIETCCADVMSTAKEARKSKLGVFQPTFNLLQMVRGSLLHNLPEDAHVRASGKLCVSLTRVSDGQNVLVSEFGSREELIQVLTCSCFFPLFCGLIPPSYRGVRYVDGALSNSMPLIDQRNTITVSPFSGEGDICPREGTFNLLEVHYGNVSIQANTGNVHRIYMSFCPPKLEVLAEICHNGYMDALHFLKKNEYLPPSLVAEVDAPKPACCEPVNSSSTEAGESKQPNGQNAPQEEHRWLDQQLIQNLPVSIKRVCLQSEAGAAGPLAWSTGTRERQEKTFNLSPEQSPRLLTETSVGTQNLKRFSLTSPTTAPPNLPTCSKPTCRKASLNHRCKQTPHLD
ncbi:patatin-like phospholipase domain-containing protein 2 [Diretmus argenteus]